MSNFQYWTDEFLTWNPSQFGGIKSLHVPADLIWKPDLLVYNRLYGAEPIISGERGETVLLVF